MTLVKNQERKAIYNQKDWGPIFGAGHDVAIADHCDINSDSYAEFPYSYNNGKYVKGQASIAAFSGAEEGSHFRVKDYEVFQLIK
jgi:hypothetical protein